MSQKTSARVMLAMLNISIWIARAYDNKATNEVKEKHNREKDIGRFNKRLLPENAPTYERVCEIGRRTRQRFYNFSLQYGQDGIRLLPADAYLALAAEVRMLRAEFEDAVEAFIDDVENLKTVAKVELNGLYSDGDYPSTAELRKKFDFRFKVLPFPDAEQFGVSLPEEDLAEIRQSINQHIIEATDTGMQDLWDRLYDVVVKLTERLSQPKARIRDELIANTQELVTLLPKLNFTGDTKLAEFCELTASRLASQNAEDLRSSTGHRISVAKQAAEIQLQMAAYMGIPLPANFGVSAETAPPFGGLLA
ncbi:MAG: hypothetical protein WAO76_03605 [Georgfuchsia sp.]